MERKPSSHHVTVVPNPLMSLQLPKAKRTDKEEQGLPKPSAKKIEGSSDKSSKQVTQVFAQAHPKRSIGGTSSLLLLPHAHSPLSLSQNKGKEEAKPSQITPRIRETKTPRSHSTATHLFTPALPSSFKDVEEAHEHLMEFNTAFQDQMKLLQQMFQSSKEGEEDHAEVESDQALGHQMLTNALARSWISVRKEMDQLLLAQGEDDAVAESSDEATTGCSINLHNLGLSHFVDAEATGHSTSKASLTKASLSLAKKSLKEEKPLQIAFPFMASLILDLQEENGWVQKDNIKRMLQFVPSKFEMTKALPDIAFNYINQLFLIGEILKQGSQNIDQIVKDGHPLAVLPLEYAQKFLKAIREMKEIKKLEKEEGREQVDRYCYQYGETVISYAKGLLKFLHHYIEVNNLQFPNRTFYNCPLIEQMERDLCARAHMYCEGFEMDFQRSVKGRFLHLVSDKEGIAVPKITKEARKNGEGFTLYCHQLLAFLMQNFDIDCEADLKPFNPLKMLAEARSLAAVYERLEKEWKLVKAASEKPKIEGVFKLLPILRIFNQNNLLGLHKGMLMMQKAMETLPPAQASHLPLSFPFPSAESSKTQQKDKGELLDRESKSIQIEFREGKVYLVVKRVAALAHSLMGSSDASHSYFFPDCAVTASFTLSVPIQNMDDWSIETFVELDRPKESSNLVFLRRYSLMIAVLNSMGIKFQENFK